MEMSYYLKLEISIHALREEGDHGYRATFDNHDIFLSTPSARRATVQRQGDPEIFYISIHALREEGDSRRKLSCTAHRYFYPRPPRGGRPLHLPL